MRSLLVILLVGTLSACHPNCTIPKNDLKLIPYKGNETLIFKSSKGDMDTIRLQGIETFKSWKDNWGIFYSPNVESKMILAKVSNWGYTDAKSVSYLDSTKFLVFENDGETKFEPNFHVNNSWFYGDSVYTKKALLEAKQVKLMVDNFTYDDIVVLTPNKSYQEKYNGAFVDRANTIYKLYWSLTNGVVRYDKKDLYWELIKKY